MNLEEAIEFEFEGQKYTVSVELPNGDVGRLAEAKIKGDGNFAQRFNTSLLPQENGYTLVIGALDGVPTAEIMRFSNLNASAKVTQKLTNPETEIILSGTSAIEEEISNLEEFRAKFATTTRATASVLGWNYIIWRGTILKHALR